MKNFKWDCNLTRKFVKLYLSKRCLWDRYHPDFKDSKSKYQAFREIAHEMKRHMDIDVAGVKAKIRCLRSTYSQEVSKISRRSTDPDNIYEPSLPWFNEMDTFLKKNYTPRPEYKWSEQEDTNNYPEEHLDEQLLENSEEVGEITENEPQEEDSKVSDVIYTDALKTKWGSDVTVEFVKCYLKHECLWNPKHPEYTYNNKKVKAYKDIIFTMNKYVKMDINGIRTKVRNLRNTYTKELVKIVEKSRDPEDIYKPAMPWFKLMDEKLKNVVQLRSKLITLDGQHNKQRDHHKKTDKTSIDKELLRNIKTDMDDMNDDSMNDDCNDDMNDGDSYDEDNDDQMEHEESNKDILFIEPPNTKDGLLFEDEYDIFGKYVAAQLRRLELKPALQAKADILNILSKARIDALDT